MADTETQDERSVNTVRHRKSKAYPMLDEVEVRTGLSLLDLVKTLAYMDAVDLEQLRITKKGDRWLLMLKGTFRGQRKVSFIEGRRFPDVIQTAVTAADSGYLVWKDDKVPPWEKQP